VLLDHCLGWQCTGIWLDIRATAQHGKDGIFMLSSEQEGSRVERLPSQQPSTIVTDELGRVLAILRDSCPKDATISFDFDGKLHVHIDIRKQEDVLILESILPTLGLGMFKSLRRGTTPNRPFFHRLSALVDR
jgi:hypothetical protein